MASIQHNQVPHCNSWLWTRYFRNRTWATRLPYKRSNQWATRSSELMQDRIRNYRNCTKGKYMLVKYKIMLHCRDFLIKVDDNLGNMEVLSGLKGIWTCKLQKIFVLEKPYIYNAWHIAFLNQVQLNVGALKKPGRSVKRQISFHLHFKLNSMYSDRFSHTWPHSGIQVVFCVFSWRRPPL